MSKPIIKVENIGKQYRLGTVGTGTFSHDVNRWWHKVRGKEDPYLKIGEVNDRAVKGDSEYVWALKDINFEVQPGEILGIIGKNGAGKSTLLKLLSRVTAPTTGKITCHGRIASLLEVGTGFHPELTGKENIFLNGAILGMTKKEIAAKFDEIVDFAGCAKYIDTPVKRYSSGMYVRLAFAVAAHLEPDILVVDEVLAVGDAEFQKKAIGKMKEVSQGQGRTVLFVSHNMASVRSLCNRGIVLTNGSIAFKGSAEESVSFYLKDGNSNLSNIKKYKDVSTVDIFRLNQIKIKNKNRTFEDPIVENDDIILETNLTIYNEPDRYHLTYHLVNEFGEAVFSFTHRRYNLSLKKGENLVTVTFPSEFLQSGNYGLKFFLIEDRKKAIYVEDSIFNFTIVDAGRELGTYMGKEPGNIKPKLHWEIH